MSSEMSKRRMLMWFALGILIHLLVSTYSEAAECRSETHVPSNAWVQYSTPCLTAQSPSQLFSGPRGGTWQLFGYDGERYTKPDVLVPGEGYWVIQFSGVPVNVVTTGPIFHRPPIVEIDGWGEWDMVGSPIGGELSWDKVNVLTDDEWYASNDSHVHIFSWNPDLQRYDTPVNSGFMRAGRAMWITTRLPSNKTGAYFGRKPASGPTSWGWL